MWSISVVCVIVCQSLCIKVDSESLAVDYFVLFLSVFVSCHLTPLPAHKSSLPRPVRSPPLANILPHCSVELSLLHLFVTALTHTLPLPGFSVFLPPSHSPSPCSCWFEHLAAVLGLSETIHSSMALPTVIHHPLLPIYHVARTLLAHSSSSQLQPAHRNAQCRGSRLGC